HDPGDVLRVHRLAARMPDGQVGELLTDFPVVADEFREMRVVALNVEQWKERAKSSFDVADECQIEPGAPTKIFAAPINLDNKSVVGIELCVRKIGAQHQERVGLFDGVVTGRKTNQAGESD